MTNSYGPHEWTKMTIFNGKEKDTPEIYDIIKVRVRKYAMSRREWSIGWPKKYHLVTSFGFSSLLFL